MLRISITQSSNGATTLVVEGQLAGPWVCELSSACERLLATGVPITLDLRDVLQIDRPGFDLLASFAHRGVTLTHCSPFQEEQLRQTATATLATTTAAL